MALSIKKVEKWAQKKKVDKLLKALSTEDIEVRIAVIKALGATKTENAMNALIPLLNHADPQIRLNTVEALGIIGIGRSLEFVRQLWNSEANEEVREKAKLAMNAIKENSQKEEKH